MKVGLIVICTTHGGYGLRGQQVWGEVSGKRYARESFIAGKNGSRIIAPMCFDGACNTEIFNTWLEQVLTTSS